jgi:hypothetical protein
MNKHVDSYLKEAVENVEERFDGYRMFLRQTASRIVEAERKHAIKRIDIKKQVNDEIAELAKKAKPKSEKR